MVTLYSPTWFLSAVCTSNFRYGPSKVTKGSGLTETSFLRYATSNYSVTQLIAPVTTKFFVTVTSYRVYVKSVISVWSTQNPQRLVRSEEKCQKSRPFYWKYQFLRGDIRVVWCSKPTGLANDLSRGQACLSYMSDKLMSFTRELDLCFKHW